MIKASLHSIETMGLVDGPGIRTVFFLQGCPLRCLYCHNPDSQNFMAGKTIDTRQVVDLANRYKAYYRASGGGVTFSGGEPLMQGAFLIEALSALKAQGIHTCIDTSGYGMPKYYEEIFKLADMFLLDVKHVEAKAHEHLVGRSIDGIISFIKALKKFKGKVIIRHVMLPGETDDYNSMRKLLNIIEPIEKKVEKIEILPYRKTGMEKYSRLNRKDPLSDVPPMSPKLASKFEKWVNEQLLLRRESKIAV